MTMCVADDLVAVVVVSVEVEVLLDSEVVIVPVEVAVRVEPAEDTLEVEVRVSVNVEVMCWEIADVVDAEVAVVAEVVVVIDIVGVPDMVDMVDVVVWKVAVSVRVAVDGVVEAAGSVDALTAKVVVSGDSEAVCVAVVAVEAVLLMLDSCTVVAVIVEVAQVHGQRSTVSSRLQSRYPQYHSSTHVAVVLGPPWAPASWLSRLSIVKSCLIERPGQPSPTTPANPVAVRINTISAAANPQRTP